MVRVADLALPEKILLAAARLDEAGQSPFSAEALIVSAWQLYPRTFGLKGYEEQYPDSNKVLWGIMGSRGLPQRGWLGKVGQKLYVLTDDGRQALRLLEAGESLRGMIPARASLPRLTREQDVLLQGLLASAAWQKLRQGRSADWTFTDAVKFWDLGERRGEALDSYLTERRRLLRDVERILSAGVIVLGNGVRLSTAEMGSLLDVHDQLQARFVRHLTLLRNRAETR